MTSFVEKTSSQKINQKAKSNKNWNFIIYLIYNHGIITLLLSERAVYPSNVPSPPPPINEYQVLLPRTQKLSP